MSLGFLLGVALFTAAGTVLLRRYDPTYAILMAVAGGLVVLWGTLSLLSDVINAAEELLSRAGIHRGFLTLLLKAMGICYLCQFGADICRDAGESAMAGHVELAGKLMTIVVALPMIREVAQTILKLLE